MQWGSPAIDAGDPDLDGDGEDYTTDPDDQDPDSTRMDMGAYYFDQSDPTPPTVSITSLSSNNVGTADNLIINWEANDWRQNRTLAFQKERNQCTLQGWGRKSIYCIQDRFTKRRVSRNVD